MFTQNAEARGKNIASLLFRWIILVCVCVCVCVNSIHANSILFTFLGARPASNFPLLYRTNKLI